ncbi:hypothetical protein VUR80DRAFT_7347 [Thermomyces stellatus]
MRCQSADFLRKAPKRHLSQLDYPGFPSFDANIPAAPRFRIGAFPKAARAPVLPRLLEQFFSVTGFFLFSDVTSTTPPTPCSLSTCHHTAPGLRPQSRLPLSTAGLNRNGVDSGPDGPVCASGSFSRVRVHPKHVDSVRWSLPPILPSFVLGEPSGQAGWRPSPVLC